VGARKLLVAFNANLATSDLEAARAIAHALRERDGGLPHVRALGFLVEAGRRAQVSMNLVDSDATPLHVVLARLRDEAARRGIGIHNYEVVGLISEQALKGARDDELAREIIARDQVLETRLRRALPDAIRSSDR
jgi:glutamate formiminotransferase